MLVAGAATHRVLGQILQRILSLVWQYKVVKCPADLHLTRECARIEVDGISSFQG